MWVWLTVGGDAGVADRVMWVLLTVGVMWVWLTVG